MSDAAVTSGEGKAGLPSGSLRRGLLLPVGLAAVLLTALVLGALWRVADRQDEIAVADSLEIAQSVIDAFQRHLRRVTWDQAHANETLARTLGALDPVWAHQRLGVYLAEEHGVRLALVLAADGRAAFAVVDREVQDDFDLSRLDDGVAALIEAARLEASDPSPGAAAGLIRMDGEVHVAAAAALAHQQGVAPASAGILLLARSLRGNLIRQLDENYNLTNVHIVGESANREDATLELRTLDGQPLATLGWAVRLPGRQTWQAASPIVLLGLGLLLALFWIFQRGVRRAIGAVQDAREKLAARNEELARSEGRLLAVLDNAADAILTVAASGEIASANKAAGRILGGAPESFVGTPLSAFLASPFDWRSAAPGSREGRTVVRAIDGRERLVELSSSAIRTAEFDGYVVVAQDVTDRLTAKDALDLVRTPLLVLDRQLRVVLANRSALQLVDRHGGLSIDSERLAFAQPREQAAFRDLLGRSATAATLATISVARPQGGPPLLLHVRSLGPDTKRVGAVVHLQDLSRKVQVDPAALQKALLLTPAEARVVIELVNGKAPGEIAEAFSLSVSTVRNQLKQAYRKAGVRSQSELVEAVLSATAVLSEET